MRRIRNSFLKLCGSQEAHGGSYPLIVVSVSNTPHATKTKHMSEFIERLRTEHLELGEKVDKLRGFLKSPQNIKVNLGHLYLLKLQEEAMSKYHDILTARLDLLTHQ